MRIKVGERVLRLRFQYSVEEGSGVRITDASLEDDNGVTILFGTSYCNPLDTFRKVTGRKISLARALSSGLSREERQDVWNQYHHMTGRRERILGPYPDQAEGEKEFGGLEEIQEEGDVVGEDGVRTGVIQGGSETSAQKEG